MAISATFDTRNNGAIFEKYYRFAEQRLERAALIATDRAVTEAKGDLRTAMQAARLGGLGNAISSTSDIKKGRGVYRVGKGFRASGVLFIRTTSPRTVGAIEAYTQGADIRPRKGRYLWIPTDDVQRLVGKGKDRRRLEPGLWVQSGLDRRIGPLVRIKSVNGYPLLTVQNVGVSAAGKKRSARSRTKSGRPRKGQVAKAFIVAFIGIPYTSRAARINVRSIVRVAQGQMQNYFYQALGRDFDNAY